MSVQIERLPDKLVVPSVPKYRAQCPCGCIFTYLATDKKIYCVGHGDFRSAIRCPNCHELCGIGWDNAIITEIGRV